MIAIALAILLLTRAVSIHVIATGPIIRLSKCDQPDYCPSSDGPWQSFMIEWSFDGDDFYREPAAVYPTLWDNTQLILGPEDADLAKYSEKLNSTLYIDYHAERFRASLSNSSFSVGNSLEAWAPAVDSFEVDKYPHQVLQVGQLGLGPTAFVVYEELRYRPGIIELLQKNKSIESASWSLHLGSALHGPRNSLTVGGYDQSRAVGDVGAFDIVLGAPRAFIVDIALGIEEGASPFSLELNLTAGQEKSTWQSLGGIAADSGAAYGASIMNFSATYPGIYLPLNNCDAIAKHLPVVWRQDIQYYAWDTSDSRYQDIVSSAAYLSFVLSDRSAKNITVKLPFLLLNLTLESPYVDTPTPYFPCRPSQDNTTLLGRAFLQSAFIGINYDTSLAYIAQAPGPSIGQFVAADFPQNDAGSFPSQPSPSFAQSWASTWKPLAETSQAPSSKKTHGLSPGSIAGLTVGIVMALVIVGLSAWIIWRRGKKAALKTKESTNVTEVRELHAQPSHVHELRSSKVQDIRSASLGREPSELPAM